MHRFFTWVRFEKRRILIVRSQTVTQSSSLASQLKHIFDARHNLIVRTHSLQRESKSRKSMLLTKVKLNMLVKDFHPDAIIATNPTAQNFVRQSYLNSPNIKLVFAGLNSPENKKTIYTLNNVTGLVTQEPFQMIKSFLQEIHFKGRRVFLLGYNNSRNVQYINALKKINFSPYSFLSPHLANNFSEWKALIQQAKENADLLLVLDYQGMKDEISEQTKSRSPTQKHLVSYLLEHNTLPMISTTRHFAQLGGPISFTPYYKNSAKVIAWLTVHFLNMEDTTQSIPLVIQNIVNPEINAYGFRQFFPGYTIPDVYTSYAKAINAYYQKGEYDFIGKVQSIDIDEKAITGATPQTTTQ